MKLAWFPSKKTAERPLSWVEKVLAMFPLPGGKRKTLARRPSRRLSFDVLEDRTLPSASVIATIPFSNTRASTLVTDPGLQRVFVAEEDYQRIAVVDAATNTVLTTVPTLGYHSMDVDPVGHRVYVGQQFAGKVRVIDGVTATVITDLAIPGLIHTIGDVAVNPLTQRLYVVRANNNDVAVMDLTTNSFMGAITVPTQGPQDLVDLAVDSATNRIYLTNRHSQLVVIDGASNTVLNTVSFASNATRWLAVNPTNHRLYITSYQLNSVMVLDGTPGSPTEFSVLATVSVQTAPIGAAVNPVTDRIYVANSQSGTVSVIDGAANIVVENVTVSPGPGSVGVVPALNRIYVGCGENPVNVIEDIVINPATPVFSNLTSATVIVGAAATTLSGTLAAPSSVPAGETVTITVNGTTATATIQADGSFAAAFPTAALGVGAYTIDYSYPGSTNFEAAHGTATLNVTYGIDVLSDHKKAKKAGSTIPIQIALLNAAGQNVSAANVSITAIGIARLSDPDTIMPAEDAGNSNPDNLFRFQGGARPFYQYNLKTPKSLSPGTYLFFFKVEGDPILHSVQFTIK